MNAAIEHAGTLRTLYDAGYFVLAIYVSGVAVEAMLRAYRMKIDPRFESRHDLSRLAEEAKFEKRVPWEKMSQFSSDMSTLSLRWSNAHRYRSSQALLRRLKKSGLCRGIRGDALKENARKCVNASVSLVTLGELLWK
ncbi:MAG TPA: hypothetical protein VHY37_04975 [Tepidisphaeraceae bacterium]|jgi:hypothetical protein|nr:hypothetical protein [Tepidisphaeraceae bacterium]